MVESVNGAGAGASGWKLAVLAAWLAHRFHSSINCTEFRSIDPKMIHKHNKRNKKCLGVKQKKRNIKK